MAAVLLQLQRQLARSGPVRFARYWPAALVVGAWLLGCWQLGSLSLLDPDEAHYAQITTEMNAAGTWGVPLLEGRPHIDKPVFFHWVQGAAFRVFGRSEFAARLPSAVSALVLVGLVGWFGRRVFDTRTALRAVALLSTMPATFALTNVGIFDMTFTMFLFGTLACVHVAVTEDRPWLQYAGFVLAAGAVLTKGPAAVILMSLTTAVACLHPGARRAAGVVRWWQGLAIVVLLTGPWFLWMWRQFGQVFVDEYIFRNNLSLFAQPLYRRRHYPFFYVRTLLTAFLPWSLVMLGRGVDLWRTRTRLRDVDTAEFVLWAWVLVVVGFFSLSRFKLDTYIFPAAPAMCLVAARGWEIARRERGRPHLGITASLFAVALLMIVVGVAAAHFLFDLDLPVSRAAVLLPAALLAGGVGFAIQLTLRQGRPPRFGAAALLALFVGYATVVGVGFPVLEETRAAPAIGRWIASAPGAGVRLGLYRLGRWQASLRFYAARPVTVLATPEELRAFLAQPNSYCVLTRRDLERLGFIDELRVVYERRAVVGADGRVLRRQRWGGVVVATMAPVGGGAR